MNGKTLRYDCVRWMAMMAVTIQATIGFAAQREDGPLPAPKIRFAAVDVFIDAGDKPLSAYQVTISLESGAARIAGIEGGEHPAFREPPYYDPRAIQGERIILAAFNTAKELPRGRTRVATLHVRVTGNDPVKFSSALEVSADVRGKRIPAEVSIQERK